MKHSVRAITLCCLLMACCTVDPAYNDKGQGDLAIDFGPEIREDLSQVLLTDPHLELVAVDPAWPTEESRADPSALYGYQVLGRAELNDRKQRLALLTTFAKGAHENNDTVAACFDPRHAIRAEVDGKRCDVLICFECLQFYVYDGKERVEQGMISKTPRPEFNRIYESLGLSIAE